MNRLHRGRRHPVAQQRPGVAAGHAHVAQIANRQARGTVELVFADDLDAEEINVWVKRRDGNEESALAAADFDFDWVIVAEHGVPVEWGVGAFQGVGRQLFARQAARLAHGGLTLSAAARLAPWR